jgi:hypothetical protein
MVKSNNRSVTSACFLLQEWLEEKGNKDEIPKENNKSAKQEERKIRNTKECKRNKLIRKRTKEQKRNTRAKMNLVRKKCKYGVKEKNKNKSG